MTSLSAIVINKQRFFAIAYIPVSTQPDIAYTKTMTTRKPVIEVMSDDMAKILRKKSPAERLEIAFGMWRSTRNMLTSLLTSQNPDWSKDRVTSEVARRLSHGAC